MTKSPHVGSSFDSFLAEQDLLDEVNAVAQKQVLALQIAAAMKRRRISKSDLAKRMRTSRSALDRLLDPNNPSVTLATMDRAASALGKRLRIRLEDAGR
jgi:antitoxin HicB